MQKASPEIRKHKDVLGQYTSQPVTGGKPYSQSREKTSSTIRLISNSDETSFPYAWVQVVHFMKGNIYMLTNTAAVEIRGKNLRPLFLDIERFKTDSISLSPIAEEGSEQPFVEAINIEFLEDWYECFRKSN